MAFCIFSSDVLSQVSSTSVVDFLMLGIFVRIQGFGVQIQTDEPCGAPVKAERVAVVTTPFLLAATYTDAVACGWSRWLLCCPGEKNIFAHMRHLKHLHFDCFCKKIWLQLKMFSMS